MQQHRRARQQHERRANLGDRKEIEAPAGGAGNSHRSTRQFETAGTVARGQPRHEGEQHRGDQRQSDGDREERHVQLHVQRTRRKPRRISRQHRHHGRGQRDSQDGAAAAQQQALGQQRAPQRTGVRPERGSHRELGFAPHRACEHQVGDVGTGDDEHQDRCRHQHDQERPRASRELISEADGVDRERGARRIGLRVLADEGAVHLLQFRARTLETGGGCQPSEGLGHPVLASRDHRGREMMRAGDDVRDELGFRRIGHGRFEDADDDGRAGVEANRSAENGGIPLEGRGPEAVGEDRRAGRARRRHRRDSRPGRAPAAVPSPRNSCR